MYPRWEVYLDCSSSFKTGTKCSVFVRIVWCRNILEKKMKKTNSTYICLYYFVTIGWFCYFSIVHWHYLKKCHHLVIPSIPRFCVLYPKYFLKISTLLFSCISFVYFWNDSINFNSGSSFIFHSLIRKWRF